MVRRRILPFRHRKRKSSNTRMTATPASPPTTPPTTAGVLTGLLPPDPAPEVAEDDGAEAVLLGPPILPAIPPVLDPDEVAKVVEAAEEERDVLEAVEPLEVEAASEVWLEDPGEKKKVPLVVLDGGLVDVSSVLFELRLEDVA